MPAGGADRHTLGMVTTLVFLVRHAKAANRDVWTGGDRGRPLVERGRAQAERLAAALRHERPVLVAASPWLRCRQTAAPLAAAVGLQVELDLDRFERTDPRLAGAPPTDTVDADGRLEVFLQTPDTGGLYQLSQSTPNGGWTPGHGWPPPS